MKAIRLIISPLLFIIVFYHSIIKSFRITYLFICYGGEFITIESESEKKTINDIYELMKKNHNRNVNKCKLSTQCTLGYDCNKSKKECCEFE